MRANMTSRKAPAQASWVLVPEAVAAARRAAIFRINYKQFALANTVTVEHALQSMDRISKHFAELADNERRTRLENTQY